MIVRGIPLWLRTVGSLGLTRHTGISRAWPYKSLVTGATEMWVAGG